MGNGSGLDRGLSNPPDKTKTRLSQQYYSGSETSIFIGDIWVDDITSIDYNVQNTKTPIYGYGSQHFDFIPKGAILVAGALTINLREPNYLWLILDRYKRFNTLRDRTGISTSKRKEDQIDINFDNTFENDERANFDLFFKSKNPTRTAKDLRKKQKIKTGSKDNIIEEKFNHSAFNIVIGYGNKLDKETIGERLISVHLTGKGKSVRMDGRPIQESYTFIARQNY